MSSKSAWPPISAKPGRCSTSFASSTGRPHTCPKSDTRTVRILKPRIQLVSPGRDSALFPDTSESESSGNVLL